MLIYLVTNHHYYSYLGFCFIYTDYSIMQLEHPCYHDVILRQCSNGCRQVLLCA